MNRAAKLYCSKGRHPRWKWWRAEYKMDSHQWDLRGEVCCNCGARVVDSVARAPSPVPWERKRLIDAIYNVREQLQRRGVQVHRGVLST